MKPEGTTIRLAGSADLPQLIAISHAASSAHAPVAGSAALPHAPAQWTRRQWLDIFDSQNPQRLAWIARCPASPEDVGFLVAQCGSPDWELENIAVLPGFRCQGIGSALLSALLEEARIRRAERILLEVRVSNLSAIRLYTQADFQRLARRSGYYQNPPEDALIYEYLVAA
jgi:[ribosomal protein S18]-alanine N-acetyltransferase